MPVKTTSVLRAERVNRLSKNTCTQASNQTITQAMKVTEKQESSDCEIFPTTKKEQTAPTIICPLQHEVQSVVSARLQKEKKVNMRKWVSQA